MHKLSCARRLPETLDCIRDVMDTNRPCPHLAPAANKLLRVGAEFIGVSPANGDFRFVHELNRGPAPHVAKELALAHGIEYWTSNDAHYLPLDSGFACRSCRLAIAWPQDRAVIDAI